VSREKLIGLVERTGVELGVEVDRTGVGSGGPMS
jgi:hypothetical protein